MRYKTKMRISIRHAVWFIGTMLSLLVLSVYLLSPFTLRNIPANAQSTSLNFPADHAQHTNYKFEWWYLNISTKTQKTDGSDIRELANIVSFSRINGFKNLLSSRYDNQSKSFNEQTTTSGSGQALVNNGLLYLNFSKSGTYANLEELVPGSDRRRTYRLSGYTPIIGNFNLTLKEKKVVSSGYNTPLLWGCNGVISVFGENDTNYYSIPDLDISGYFIDTDGIRRNVISGKAWIDHQWFNSIPTSAWKGHYWTMFHFSYGADAITSSDGAFAYLTQIYSEGPRYTYWVRRNSDGSNSCGTGGTLRVTGYSNRSYPATWSISSGNFNIQGTALSDNQIFTPPANPYISLPSFIEANSTYTGTYNGIAIKGAGFFETHVKDLPYCWATWEGTGFYCNTSCLYKNIGTDCYYSGSSCSGSKWQSLLYNLDNVKSCNQNGSGNCYASGSIGSGDLLCTYNSRNLSCGSSCTNVPNQIRGCFYSQCYWTKGLK